MKKVPFVTRFMKWVPSLSKMVYEGGKGLDMGAGHPPDILHVHNNNNVVMLDQLTSCSKVMPNM